MGYVIQDAPDEGMIVTLKDEYGGVFHIDEDDSCLILRNASGGLLTHWFPEALYAVWQLMDGTAHVDEDGFVQPRWMAAKLHVKAEIDQVYKEGNILNGGN